VIFVDASALVAVMLREPDATDLAYRIRQRQGGYTSPIALYEATLAIVRVRRVAPEQARSLIEEFLAETSVRMTPITAEIDRLAIDAFARYGRGNHPARLNLGDCFAYACARHLDVPLLCKGDDFPQTDISLA
jgi:ribonuclease VapC